MLPTNLVLIPFAKFQAWLDPSLTKADHLAKVSVDISKDLGALGYPNCGFLFFVYGYLKGSLRSPLD